MKKLAATLLSILICTVIYSNDYSVKDFGAKGDSLTLCTEAINKAIKECSSNGGGKVYFPAGKYLTGTIFMKDHVELYLDRGAVIYGSGNPDDYPNIPIASYRSQKDPCGWYALIFANEANDIAICGAGTIDGNGAKQKGRKNCLKGDRDGRSRNILFISCKNVTVEGITMKNAGIWNQHYLNCEDVIIDNIKVYNHCNRNNDAIDIDGCRRLILSNSILDSDDDCITLKSTGPAPCEDIAINNCIASSCCNAVKCGTESTGGFKNIAISNIVIKPSRTKEVTYGYKEGITALSLEIVDGGTMDGITVSNIVAYGTKCPLYIRLGNRARKYTEGIPEPDMGQMRNISISNFTAYNTGNFCSSISAVEDSYIENVQLSNIKLINEGGLIDGQYKATVKDVEDFPKEYPQPTMWKELPSSVFFIRKVKNISINGLYADSNKPDPRPAIIAQDVSRITIDNASTGPNLTSGTFIEKHNVTDYKTDKPVKDQKISQKIN